jgi:hypothetical protein
MPLPGRFIPGKRPSTHCTGAGWAPGPVWWGKSTPTRFRSPDRTTRSQQLHWIRYPSQQTHRSPTVKTAGYKEWHKLLRCSAEGKGGRKKRISGVTLRPTLWTRGADDSTYCWKEHNVVVTVVHPLLMLRKVFTNLVSHANIRHWMDKQPEKQTLRDILVALIHHDRGGGVESDRSLTAHMWAGSLLTSRSSKGL